MKQPESFRLGSASLAYFSTCK